MRKLTLEVNKDILADISMKDLKTSVAVLKQLKSNLEGIKDSVGL
jgi:hypothetical protein